MANIVYRILEEYNLIERLHCIISDNASNNYALTRKLSNKLRRDAGIEWNYETQHLPCVAHVINLLVKKLLSAIKKKTPIRGARTVDDAESKSDDNMDLDLDDIPEADGTAFRVLLATIGLLPPFDKALLGGRYSKPPASPTISSQ